MAADNFLKIPGINGESLDSKHKNEIEVMSWSLGASQAGSGAYGSGSAVAKVTFSDLSIAKHLDKASPALMLACANGKHIGDVLLTCRKAGETPMEYLKVTLSEALVSSYSASGSDGSGLPMEALSFNFSKITFEYFPQKADGTADAGQKTGWNIKENIKV